MGSTWFSSTFLDFLKFPQIKEGAPNFLGGTNSAQRLNYFVPRSVFQFQKFEGLKFFGIHWSSMGSNWFTSAFLNFLNFPKLKMWNLISWGEPILQNSWIIWSPLLYFNSRNFRDSNSSSFIALPWVPIDSPVLFSIFWNFLKLKTGDLISWWEQIRKNSWIIWSPLLYFNFRNLKHPNSSSFFRFQWILHDPSALLWIFLNFFKLKRRP